mmetsp:Transcript_37279/g.73304  ORF Transcript_37279/g.73304 Transcript_37279/m.73304 type:complete len:310 (-) Transcript_37279:1338-2267(-)
MAVAFNPLSLGKLGSIVSTQSHTSLTNWFIAGRVCTSFVMRCRAGTTRLTSSNSRQRHTLCSTSTQISGGSSSIWCRPSLWFILSAFIKSLVFICLRRLATLWASLSFCFRLKVSLFSSRQSRTEGREDISMRKLTCSSSSSRVRSFAICSSLPSAAALLASFFSFFSNSRVTKATCSRYRSWYSSSLSSLTRLWLVAAGAGGAAGSEIAGRLVLDTPLAAAASSAFKARTSFLRNAFSCSSSRFLPSNAEMTRMVSVSAGEARRGAFLNRVLKMPSSFLRRSASFRAICSSLACILLLSCSDTLSLCL